MQLPERIGGYVVERELGAGGMGTVYLARSRGGRTVAAKVARPELAADPHFRARFRAEVEAARKVGGFHTAPVVDADPDAPAPWLATVYIAGPTLSGLLAGRGPMNEPQLRLLGAALAEALQAIHACGLIHRDLKPGNIIMAEDGPRVLDFGIARAVESTRLTSTGAAFGTPGFLAPEQAQGLEVGPSADVFALGVVLVAAAGGSAFGEGTPMGLMYRSVHEAADLSAVPEGIRPVVAECLAKDPAQRPTLEALLDLLAPETVRAAEPDPPPATAPAAHPLTVPDPAPAPAATITPAAPATSAGLPHAATVTADPRPAGTPGSPPRSNARPFTIALAATALVAGLAILTTYLTDKTDKADPKDDAPFPKAVYELTVPAWVLREDFKVTDDAFPTMDEPLPDDANSKGVKIIKGDFFGADETLASNRTFEVSGYYGQFKQPELERGSEIQERTGTSSTGTSGAVVKIDDRKKVHAAGWDVEISCVRVIDSSYTNICAWGDANTVGRVIFDDGSPIVALDRAADETYKIRQAMRKKIVH
ncbi:serine/threonine-protein kinase [Streptomyces sp. NPDC051561]|uniref:serine/threonine-protein kinase n=1 Tax=Streptomyces sp. NPDC051561 TaxID=3365658 RepID=UPI00379A8F71